MRAIASRLRAAIILKKFYQNFGNQNLRNGKRCTSLFHTGLLICLILTKNAAAQNGRSEWHDDISGRPFWANVLYFQDDETVKTLIEVLVEVPYRSLAFQKIGEAYETNVGVGVGVDDADGFQIDGNIVSEKIRTRNFFDHAIKSANADFPFRVSA